MMTLSAVPITAQDGMVFQAGFPEGSDSVLAASGRWVAAMTAAWLAGRPRGLEPQMTVQIDRGPSVQFGYGRACH